jgi:hypothetical protein
MVSNTLHIDLQELLDTIACMRKEHSGDAEYRKLRRELPADWPL